MLTKFISVSETRFQNTEIALKNQQALIQGLETQIGQLAKLISERPQELRQGIMETCSTSTHEPCSSNNKEPIYEERRLQIEELDEWRTHKPKPYHDEINISPNQLKVGDKVLLDAADLFIATPEPNGAIPLMVLNIFPYGTVKVIHPKFDTFKFPEPHGQAHEHALGRAHTTGGNTAVRYDRVKIEQKHFPNMRFNSCHGRATWPWAILPN
ncbi:hypothetical protein GOBAR_AA05954 [Gossypium barbadense]|uniref:Uncharacterized protein n=1 Tax=Gossypium barbadense TaxID=3634 RepID=A0A2P5YGC7_GOSBA|nr:hypothetical protein GOBAR_AA05954 [Gossypium barbadense]